MLLLSQMARSHDMLSPCFLGPRSPNHLQIREHVGCFLRALYLGLRGMACVHSYSRPGSYSSPPRMTSLESPSWIT